jgi:hypothetical protein
MVGPGIWPLKATPKLDDRIFWSQKVLFRLKSRVMVRVTMSFDK